jgi:type VI secretion system protein ImpL
MERFTERVTTLRLKLQQISDSADPDDQARQVAQLSTSTVISPEVSK